MISRQNTPSVTCDIDIGRAGAAPGATMRLPCSGCWIYFGKRES